jgi:hypothetical protein
MCNHSSHHLALLLSLTAFLATGTAHARDWRVAQLPNGNVFGCANCHFNPGGGGPRNLFGQSVEPLTGSSRIPFWSATLAAIDSDGDGFTNGEELGDPEGDFTTIPGAQVTRPGDPTSFPTVPPPALDVALLESAGLAMQLHWTGGRGPFIVQLRADFNDTEWMNVLTTTNSSAAVPQPGNSGFFRVGSQTPTTVIPLTAWITGSNQIPAVDSPAQSLGTLSLEGNILTYFIPFSGLVADAQAAHIHGPALSSENADVLHPLTSPSGTTGVLKGTVTLSASDRDLLLAGRTYVNIHTAAHLDGEIRGQIAPARWQALLTGDAEVPPLTTTGTGTATLELVGNQLFWRLAYSNLTGPAQAAHLHGPAGPTDIASPLVTFPVPSTATGAAEGTTTLDATALQALLDGLTYVNVHTAQHGDGEIRGQLQPAP